MYRPWRHVPGPPRRWPAPAAADRNRRTADRAPAASRPPFPGRGTAPDRRPECPDARRTARATSSCPRSPAAAPPARASLFRFAASVSTVAWLTAWTGTAAVAVVVDLRQLRRGLQRVQLRDVVVGCAAAAAPAPACTSSPDLNPISLTTPASSSDRSAPFTARRAADRVHLRLPLLIAGVTVETVCGGLAKPAMNCLIIFALNCWKPKTSPQHDADDHQHHDHAPDHHTASVSAAMPRANCRNRSGRPFASAATSLRCHQPPPSAWNSAAVSAKRARLRLHQSDAGLLLGAVRIDQREVADRAEPELHARQRQAVARPFVPPPPARAARRRRLAARAVHRRRSGTP